MPGKRVPRINRLLHYALWGRFKGLTPSPWFDSQHYLTRNRDVARLGQDPLYHFVHHGWRENRLPLPDFDLAHEHRADAQRRRVRRALQDWQDPLLNHMLRGLPPRIAVPALGQLPWQQRLDSETLDLLDLQNWPSARPCPQGGTAPRRIVDVVVPVYAGVGDTLACLHSVLSQPQQTAFELVVFDDCSPDPTLSHMLHQLARRGLLTLRVQRRNQGFIRTVNAAMALHPQRDAVLLNSDTEVHGPWLDRLIAHLDTSPLAASITPLSNNATVCSYPHTLADNPPLPASEAGQIDALAARLNAGVAVTAPTGVGFCMVLRRSAWQQTGPLDAAAFGLGYGEENDWCMRATQRGWQHLLAADVYVTHRGAVSFGGESNQRILAALATLAQRYPDYQTRIQAHADADPLAPARARLDAARLKRALAGRPVLLQVSHARGGGVARAEQEQALKARQQGWEVLQLRPAQRQSNASDHPAVAIMSDLPLALPNLNQLSVAADGMLAELLAELK
ncbi:glycosyltransferase family 2 protein, partial [Ideonella sp.]|uniref:glycosyltransferase family 2 protein n=1 Tax=Ideonella sp. TaxID=1929293 RepID=UPI003BB5C255